jgi:hypothetical protein
MLTGPDKRGSQVAFYATFFASTDNLGRQYKTNLGGFAYGVVVAFLTSRLPHFPLLLALVFLGEFLANLAYQTRPRYGAAGLQAGLAIPFAYLATTGPEWGSFTTVRTRFAGLVVAGFTAVVVHAYLWPVLPMHQLRALIAAALRATAVSLAGLFGPARPAWAGAPPSLGETVTRARDLLDDARYLPGPEDADPAYHDIRSCLQEIDVHLVHVHYAVRVAEKMPSLATKRVSPYPIRHTTATHWLRAGVDINTLRAWLGHVSLATTTISAEVDLERKTKALAKCEVEEEGEGHKPWREDKDLMEFLRTLENAYSVAISVGRAERLAEVDVIAPSKLGKVGYRKGMPRR